MNKPGKIIIIEGIWGAGKTTLIKNAIKKLSAAYIPEPNHLTAKISSENTNSITRWYFKAHKRNLGKAIAIVRTCKAIFIERSPLSSIVFSMVYLNKNEDAEMRRFNRYIKNLRENEGIKTYLVYLKPRKLKTTIAIMKGKPYLRTYGKIKFLRSLDDQLRLVIQKMEKDNLILVYKNPELKSLIKRLR